MTAPYPGASTFTLSYGPYTDARGNVQFVGMTGKLTPVDPSTGRPISLLHVPSGQVLVPTPLTVTIAADGTSSVGPIAHTDDATLSPQGWAYQMTWDASSQSPNPGSRTFYAPLSVGSTLDYDQTVTPSLLPAAAAQPVTSVVGYTGAVTGTQIAADPAVRAAYVSQLPTVGSLTYNPDGTVASDADGNTYTWNTDGTPHTQTKGGVTRTFSWNTDGTLASVS